MTDATGPDGEPDWKASYFAALAENSDLQLDKAHLLCAMNSIAASTCCDKCNEAKMVAVKCIEDLAAVSTEPCPDLGKDGHNHPANPCPKCEGRGTVEQGQIDG